VKTAAELLGLVPPEKTGEEQPAFPPANWLALGTLPVPTPPAPVDVAPSPEAIATGVTWPPPEWLADLGPTQTQEEIASQPPQFAEFLEPGVSPPQAFPPFAVEVAPPAPPSVDEPPLVTPETPPLPPKSPMEIQAESMAEEGRLMERAALAETERREAAMTELKQRETTAAQLDAVADARAQAWMQDIDRQVADIRQLRLDPNRLFHDMGVGRQIASTAAIFVGAFTSSTTGGYNVPLQMIQGAIKRDIEAQMQNFEQARGAVDLNSNLFARFMAMTGDQRKSRALAMQTQYEQAIQEAQLASAKILAPLNRLNAEQGVAQLREAQRRELLKEGIDERKIANDELQTAQAYDIARRQLAAQAAERALRLREMEAEAKAKAEEAQAKALEGRVISGVYNPDGSEFVVSVPRGTVEEAKKLREVTTSAIQNIDAANRILVILREGTRYVWGSEERNELAAEAAEILLKIQGQITGNPSDKDMKIVFAQVQQDPGSIFTMTQRNPKDVFEKFKKRQIRSTGRTLQKFGYQGKWDPEPPGLNRDALIGAKSPGGKAFSETLQKVEQMIGTGKDQVIVVNDAVPGDLALYDTKLLSRLPPGWHVETADEANARVEAARKLTSREEIEKRRAIQLQRGLGQWEQLEPFEK